MKKSEEGAQLQDKDDEVGSISIRLSPEKPIRGAYEICETTLEDGYERKTYWSPSLTSFQFDVENIKFGERQDKFLIRVPNVDKFNTLYKLDDFNFTPLDKFKKEDLLRWL